MEASLVDATNPMVFVRARDLGLTGTEPPEAIDADRALSARVWKPIRVEAADAHGHSGQRLRPQGRHGRAGHVAFTALDGTAYDADAVDLLARVISMGNCHRAFALTAAMCLAVAARIEGTVVRECVAARPYHDVRLGHPSGVLPIAASVVTRDGAPVGRARHGLSHRAPADGRVRESAVSRLYLVAAGEEIARRRAQLPAGRVLEAWGDLYTAGRFWLGEESKALLDSVGGPMPIELDLPATSVPVYYGPRLRDLDSLPPEESLKARVLSAHGIAAAWVTLDRFGERVTYQPTSPRDPMFHLRRRGGGAGHLWRLFPSRGRGADLHDRGLWRARRRGVGRGRGASRTSTPC